jgi:hypothetical protein
VLRLKGLVLAFAVFLTDCKVRKVVSAWLMSDTCNGAREYDSTFDI